MDCLFLVTLVAVFVMWQTGTLGTVIQKIKDKFDAS